MLNRITVDKIAMKNRVSGPSSSIELPPPGETSVGFPWRPVLEHLVSLLGIRELLTVGAPSLCHDLLILVDNHLTLSSYLPLLYLLELQSRHFTIHINLLMRSLSVLLIGRTTGYPLLSSSRTLIAPFKYLSQSSDHKHEVRLYLSPP